MLFAQLIFVLYGLLVGAARHAPGLADEAIIDVAAPVLFWVVVWAIDERMLRSLLKWLAIATSVVGATIFLYFIGNKGIVPNVIPKFVLVQSGAAIGLNEAAVRFFGLSSLVAAGPVWIASLLLPSDGLLPRRSLRAFAALSSIAAALVGGRRAIVLVMVLTPALLWVCSRLIAPKFQVGGESSKGTIRGRNAAILGGSLLLVSAVALASSLGLVSTSAIASSARGAVDFAFADTSTPGAEPIRREQATALIDAWSGSPVIGYGFGNVVPDYVRDQERPWNFELQYHLLLFQTGLVGVVLLFAVLVAAVAAMRKAWATSPDYASTLSATMVGAAALILANATDPYLRAPGHIWWLYIPFAVANVGILRGDVGRTSKIPKPSYASSEILAPDPR